MRGVIGRVLRWVGCRCYAIAHRVDPLPLPATDLPSIPVRTGPSDDLIAARRLADEFAARVYLHRALRRYSPRDDVAQA